MFNKYEDRIKALEKKVFELDLRLVENTRYMYEAVQRLEEDSKKTYAYTLQKKDIELIRDGKKFQEIVKIIK